MSPPLPQPSQKLASFRPVTKILATVLCTATYANNLCITNWILFHVLSTVYGLDLVPS